VHNGVAIVIILHQRPTRYKIAVPEKKHKILYSQGERVLSKFAIFFALYGTELLSLVIDDEKHHNKLHTIQESFG
jgi:hypothetical protein